MINDNSLEPIQLESENQNTDRSVPNNENSSEKTDSSLDALVKQEQSDAKQKLLAELGREPTQEEIDEWLQAHTESY